MEMEDKESTDSGSLGANSEADSPPSNGVVFGVGVGPEAINKELEKTAGAITSPEAVTEKKKRGRPRKYDADGNLRPGYVKTTPKRGRVKLKQAGYSSNGQILATMGELFTSTAGGDFTPHVVTVHTGEDVAGKILTFAHKGARGICVLSANGSVSNVTIRQPGSSGGLLSYEGRFEILSLTGSFTISDNGGMKSRTGGLSVSLASSDGRIIGGGVAGLLMAAAPIQIVVGTFVPNGFNTQKKRPHTESRMSPPVQYAPATVTAAVPISQAPLHSQSYSLPATQVPLKSQGEFDKIISNGDHTNPASTNTVDWNISGPSSEPRPSPDINISLPFEEQ